VGFIFGGPKRPYFELFELFVENYIESIDNKKKEIHLHTPDGLIDLYL
jgi:hypothetical protein